NLLKTSFTSSEKDELVDYLRNYYGNSDINKDTLKDWASCSKYISNIARLTFSDNPKEAGSPKHGIWGIGTKYSWIKMKNEPNLESLRQAFLLPAFRVRNCFDFPEIPYELPKTWIKRISITKTSLTKEDESVSFEFNPQLTTIIGGRGSGKSSILRFLRGVFGKIKDISSLNSIITEFNDFYKKEGRDQLGVFHDESKLIIEIYKNNILYKLTAKNIISLINQNISIE
ncbi:unnamed protein product, partial [marine sediment metagenome]